MQQCATSPIIPWLGGKRRLADRISPFFPQHKCYVERYDRPHTFFYIDPPYWQTEGYGIEFGWEQYEQLGDRLGKLQGEAIVSLGDHPDIRRAFDRFHIEQTDIRYTVGGCSNAAERTGLLIFRWDVQAEPSGLF